VTRREPTDDNRHEAIETALNGLACGDHLGDIAARLAPLHPRNNTFMGEVLLDLTADAIAASGANRQAPLQVEGIRERYLPDGIAHSKAQHDKSKYVLRAAAMLHGGVDPGLLDEVQWWRTDDLWYWSLEALATYVRAAADRTEQSVESMCRRIANDTTSPSSTTTLHSGQSIDAHFLRRDAPVADMPIGAHWEIPSSVVRSRCSVLADAGWRTLPPGSC